MKRKSNFTPSIFTKRMIGIFMLISLLSLSIQVQGAEDYKTSLRKKLNKITQNTPRKKFVDEHKKLEVFLDDYKRELYKGIKGSVPGKKEGGAVKVPTIKEIIDFLNKSKRLISGLPKMLGNGIVVETALSDGLKRENKWFLDVFKLYVDQLIKDKTEKITIGDERFEYFDGVEKTFKFLSTYKKRLDATLKLFGKQYTWVGRFHKAIDFVKKSVTPPWKFSIGAGFNGDKSEKADEKKELYKLDLATGLEFNDYPNVIRFNASTLVQLDGGKLEENVNASELSYRYDVYPWMGIHSFVKRSSNSYLSLLHRYEVGVSTIFQLDILPNKKRKEYKAAKAIFEVPDGMHVDYKSYEANKGKLAGDFKKLTKDGKRILRAFKEENARLSLGMGLGLMSEIDKYEITSNVYRKPMEEEKEEEKEEKFTLNGQQHFRILCEPFIVFKTEQTLTIEGRWRWILPLEKRLAIFEGSEQLRNAFRNLFTARIKIKLPHKPTMIKNVLLVLEYQREYDYVPPSIPSSMVTGTSYQHENGRVTLKSDDGSIIVKTPIAEKAHDKYSLKLNIEF